MALGLTQPLTEIVPGIFPWGKRRPVPRADNLTTFMCRLSRNLRVSASWNIQGLSRPVMGLLYLFSLYMEDTRNFPHAHDTKRVMKPHSSDDAVDQ